MKKILTLVSVLAFVSLSQAADTWLGSLPETASPTDAALIPITMGGANYNTTKANLLTNVVPKAGGTMTGALLAKVGTAASPSITSTGNVAHGFFFNSFGIPLWTWGGLVVGKFGSGLIQRTTGYLAWDSSADPNAGTIDLYLYRGGAGILDLRNGVNPQTFNIYNTYTDASNYESGTMKWNGNVLEIGSEMLGTGSSRSVQFKQGGTNIFYIDATTGALLWNTDNSRDIGSSGANRPKDLFISGNLSMGSQIKFGSAMKVYFDANNTYNDNSLALTLRGSGGTTTYFTFDTSSSSGGAMAFSGNSVKGGRTKVLTSTTAADFLYVAVPNTNAIGGEVIWTVSATDGTDTQQQTGRTQFGAVGKGTAVTAGLTTLTNAAVVSAGTLTAVLAANVATNNTFALGITATTSLTTTNLTIRWRLETPQTFSVTSL